jgi:hypothetical protein
MGRWQRHRTWGGCGSCGTAGSAARVGALGSGRGAEGSWALLLAPGAAGGGGGGAKPPLAGGPTAASYACVRVCNRNTGDRRDIRKEHSLPATPSCTPYN